MKRYELIDKLLDADFMCFYGKCPTCGMAWSGWIPCSVLMPEEGARVLVMLCDFPKPMTGALKKGFFGPDLSWSIDQLHGEPRRGVGEVTHWMPLPEGPR